MSVDYPLPNEPLRDTAREIVTAHRSGDASRLESARRRLDLLTSDDRPAPIDLVKMCESILTSGYLQTDRATCAKCGGLYDKRLICGTCGDAP